MWDVKFEEEEKASLEGKIKSLTEYIQNIESISRSKDDIIKNVSQEASTYRKLLTLFIILTILLLIMIVYLSLR